MGKQNTSLAKFNRGLISPKALARVDIKRAAFAAETMDNWTPRVFGSMMLRPATKYLASTASDAAAFNIPFIFSSTDLALVEVTDLAVRIWIDDALMSRSSVSSVVSNGTFDSNVTSWTDADESGGTSAWKIGGYMSLIGDGTNLAKRYQKITVSTADA
ncbi:MAG TPA: hypothetical protein ENH10_01650, partial [Bacteroidetes bacterium]|nr:hypothetical protein [Bacteroidota bacterium]HEX03851.1 hypothetical protein [Bacteroidota bacterium]